MKKIFSMALIILVLSGCTLFRPHKNDIEQGNIITKIEVSQLRPGMSEGQVKELMGSPILINIFTPERMEYVYTFQAGYGKMTLKRISCIFYRGRLQVIQRIGE